MESKEFKPTISPGIASLTEQAVRNAKVGEISPLLRLMGGEWKIRIGNKKGFDLIKEKIIRSAKEN